MFRRLAVIATALAMASLSAATPVTSYAVTTAPARTGAVAAVVPASQWEERPARIAVAAPAAVSMSSYRVVPGDTLGAIAARFCVHFAAYPSLAAASGIGNPNLIFPGQLITLACSAPVRVASAPVRAAAPPPPAPPPVSLPSGRAAQVVAWALAQVGKPYRWGAAGPGAYDCSGLAMASYAHVGIRLPHNAASIFYSGGGRPVSRSALQPGDLVWPYGGLGHVVIYIGGGRIVEAPHAGALVSTRSLYGFYAARRYV